MGNFKRDEVKRAFEWCLNGQAALLDTTEFPKREEADYLCLNMEVALVHNTLIKLLLKELLDG